MRLTIQKDLAAKVLKCGSGRVWINPERLADVKEAVTAEDIKSLIKAGLISKKQKIGISRVRARKRLVQKRKGRRAGQGSRKGKATARLPRKTKWIHKIRSQRNLLKELKYQGKITPSTFRLLFQKAKGGFFRSQRHIKLYIGERDLLLKNKNK